MLYINRKSTDPWFNIAAEEFVLKNFSEDCFMLWQNEPSIIVGKHQNTFAEINHNYVAQNNIPVIRRISGGGTVFHDLGNLNFTFVQEGEKENLVNFRKFTQPIIDALGTLGIVAKFEGRNNLTVKGKKISGNAEHVFRNRVLHHGTLLFSSLLSDLSAALKVEEGVFHDKAVKSVRSRVTNIEDHLDISFGLEVFKERIREFVLERFVDVKYYDFTEQDVESIRELVRDKYETWEWNYAYSPKYTFQKKIMTSQGLVEVSLMVKNGIIQSAKLEGEAGSSLDFSGFEKHLEGLPHSKEKIAEILKQSETLQHPASLDIDEFIKELY